MIHAARRHRITRHSSGAVQKTKPQHWRGLLAVLSPETAPMLGFVLFRGRRYAQRTSSVGFRAYAVADRRVLVGLVIFVVADRFDHALGRGLGKARTGQQVGLVTVRGGSFL